MLPCRRHMVKVGGHVLMSVVHLPKDQFDSKLPPRFVGPFTGVIVAIEPLHGVRPVT